MSFKGRWAQFVERNHDWVKTVTATLLGIVIGGLMTFFSQYYIEARKQRSDEIRLLISTFPRLHGHLDDCRASLLHKAHDIADFVDAHEKKSIDAKKIEELGDSFYTTYEGCQNGIVELDIFLAGVGLESSKELGRMSQSLDALKGQIFDNVADLETVKSTNALLNVQLNGALMDLAEVWKNTLSLIRDRARSLRSR